MAVKETLHMYRGEHFNVAVTRVVETREISIAILPSEGSQWEHLRLFQFLLQDSAQARELSHLLRYAAAFVRHLEDGGPPEAWCF